MKSLADMTIEEAIAYTRYRIPELRWDPGSPHEAALGLHPEDGEPILHALFFRAAWVWLSKNCAVSIPRRFADPDWYTITFMSDDDEDSSLCHVQGDIKAYCAACLLAKGEVVP